MTSVRGHEPTCPIARETWCIWTGDKCDWCSAYRKGRADVMAELVAASNALANGLVTAIDADLAEHAAELEFASLHEEDTDE